MTALLLVGLAGLLAGPVPRLMARHHAPRRSPRAALVAWQAASLAAVLAALAAAPAAAPALLRREHTPVEHLVAFGVGSAVSLAILVRLLLTGHRVGRRLRSLRAAHRELVDIVAHHDGDIRVLAHTTPTAYCLPGRGARVVLTEGTLRSLTQPELDAVLAHERAHLRGRHDLLLEYFTVAHEAVPGPLRSQAELDEVRLLIEALADRVAARAAGVVPTARALVSLAHARVPAAAMALGGEAAPVRVRLLGARAPHPAVTGAIYGYAACLVALPLALLASAWVG